MCTRIRKKYDVLSEIVFIAIVEKRKYSDLCGAHNRARVRHSWWPVRYRSRWNSGTRSSLRDYRPVHRGVITAAVWRWEPLETRLLWTWDCWTEDCPCLFTVSPFVTSVHSLGPRARISFDRSWASSVWLTTSLAIFGGLNISARKFSLRILSYCYYISPYCRQPLSWNLRVWIKSSSRKLLLWRPLSCRQLLPQVVQRCYAMSHICTHLWRMP